MLTLHTIRNPQDQRDAFAEFDPANATWLVSDLKTKLDLNRGLLKERSFLPGESILRASELWKLMLARVRPDLQFVSKEFAVTLIGHKLSSMELDWAQAPGAAKAAYDYMTQLMPVLAHPAGEEMMREWFEEHQASKTRWGRWFDLSLTLWKQFLDEGFVALPWASGVLTNESGLNEIWSRPLIVDLGAELDQVEADLLVQISQFVDVKVLRPIPSWVGEYGKALAAYEIFERKLKVTKTEAKARPQIQRAPHSYHKYTTMIAEVKDAVAQSRLWVESGVPLTDIAIAAPDIECYWPALTSYLEQEGLPSQKDHVRRLHSYPDVARWMAALRLKSGSFSEADVELSLFDPESSGKNVMTYERFKTLYTALYDRGDLKRHQEVAKRFEIELDPLSEASREDFIAWSLKQIPEVYDAKRIESIYKRLFSECPQSMRLTLRRWMGYFEQLASKVECRVRDGDPSGLAVINLSSAENSPATHMMVLGLTEQALKPSGGTAILFSDILSLASGFGFHLSSDDQGALEFEARWVLEDEARELLLSVPETDFAGAAQAPSWLWVSGARERQVHDHLSVPRPTRWDELQKASIERIAQDKGWPKIEAEYLERSLKEDLGEMTLENYGQGLIETLSPSAIEDYVECPSVFAAKRIFALSDMPELELEVDASRRGSLMHELFALLTEDPMRFDLSDEEIGERVEKAREKSKLELADPRLWPPLKMRHLDLGRRFLQFEKEIRAQFPETKTLAHEADIAGYLEIETGKLVKDRVPGSLKFVGRIDRIDQDKRGNFALYDYKSSAANVSQFGTWIKNNQIQLLLYALAVEHGLTALPTHTVMAALYYVSRPFTRDYGFKVEDADQGLYDTSDRRKRNRVSLAERDQLYKNGEEKVREAVRGILAGEFAPKPLDQKSCNICRWSALCRAPHLNS